MEGYKKEASHSFYTSIIIRFFSLIIVHGLVLAQEKEVTRVWLGKFVRVSLST